MALPHGVQAESRWVASHSGFLYDGLELVKDSLVSSRLVQAEVILVRGPESR